MKWQTELAKVNQFSKEFLLNKTPFGINSLHVAEIWLFLNENERGDRSSMHSKIIIINTVVHNTIILWLNTTLRVSFVKRIIDHIQECTCSVVEAHQQHPSVSEIYILMLIRGQQPEKLRNSLHSWRRTTMGHPSWPIMKGFLDSIACCQELI